MKKVLILFLLLLNVSLFANPFASSPSLIIIDPGHGGKDSGALYEDVFEKDLVLDFSLELKDALEDKGMDVYLTRDEDVFITLEERTELAASAPFSLSGYPIFVSVHINSFTNPSANGFEIYTKKDEKSLAMITPSSSDDQILKYSSYTNKQLNNYVNIMNKKIGESILAEIEKTFPDMTIRGLKQEAFYVLNASSMPSVLLELGFLSNAMDRNNLLNDKHIKTMAEAVATAILSL